jgi:single-stranded-DNA-specific exonuclease
MRWTFIPKPDNGLVEQLEKDLGIDSLIATLLVQRGIVSFEQAKTFFRPTLTDLHDPFLMKDMEVAVQRVEKAIAERQNILVFGDYDVDGTTAVALMSSFLKTQTENVLTYIPDRYNEGYGVSKQGIDYADDNDCALIIALDCGVKSIELVAYAKQKNIDFIICDHHLPGEELPDALAILDPKRFDCNYPYKELCGCGVGFKLIQAFTQKNGGTIEQLIPYLDLVALAIGADIVPIDGENRTLSYFGMQVINDNPRAGIKAIFGEKKKKIFNISDVVFTVAPRINAAGRVKHGDYAVALLTVTDGLEAQKLAKEIETFNSDRRDIDKNITEEAFQQIIDNKEESKFSTVIYSENWHKGVIGIVASRLIETYHKPTIVFTKSGDRYAASARSVPGFDLYKAIENCKQYLIQYGGHPCAAGFTLYPENYQKFKDAFEEEVKNTIQQNMLEPEILVDAEITFDQITPKFLRILNQFAPFGPSNMQPIFLTRNLYDTGYAKCIGADAEHLSLYIKNNTSTKIPAVGFNLKSRLSLVSNHQPFMAVYTIDENEYQGKTNIQLRLKDIKSN